jgi:uncharacterized protein (DUF1697 family)
MSRGSAKVVSYALLLRGVNVGTKNTLPMAELRAMLEHLGCTDVRTYVQSGNAVFGTTLPAAKLTAAIEAALAEAMGRPIATTLRTERELRRVVDRRPFPGVANDPKYLCVTFLSHEPTEAELAPLHAMELGDERLEVDGREIYTWHPHGQARSALAAAVQKLKLRGAVTTRNWNTVTKLLEMLGADR